MHVILHEIGSTIHNTSSCAERAESLATGTQLFLFSGRTVKVETLMISKQALEEYKEIHKQETNTVLADEVLLDEAINLLTLFDRVYRPIKKVWLQEYGRNHTRSRMGTTKPKRRDRASISSEEDTGTPPPSGQVQASR